MDKLIKRKFLIINREKIDSSEVITIRKNTRWRKQEPIRLSDVFNYIPHGIVHKEETGMGATYLELKAKRNSIIVEPIKITAYSKAKHHIGTLYVGSGTQEQKERTKISYINRYVENPDINQKKIIVVADSLNNVIKAIGDNVFHQYFLLIDEVDSFQMDSTFRKSMELCLDIYKKFNPTNRCLLTSTLLDFSNPDLATESKTIIKYNIPLYLFHQLKYK